MAGRFFDRLVDISWKALLFVLPFSSFTLLSKAFGGTSVAPLSLVPLGVLILFVVLPTILRRALLPGQVTPLLFFFAFAFVSMALAYFKDVPSFRDIPLWRNQLEGVVTLLFGLGFYFVTIHVVDRPSRLASALRWINLGSLFIFVPAVFQFFSWKLTGNYPDWMQSLQDWLTSSGTLYPNRLTGVALEPSWLAHQLNILYIPLWLGFTVKGYSVHKTRLLKRFTLENLLLALGLVTLFFSFSRIGWLTTLFVGAYLVFRGANNLLDRQMLREEGRATHQRTAAQRFGRKLLLWAMLGVGLVAVLLLLGIVLTRVDPRMARLFDLERFRQFGLLGWASQLQFAERLIYWIAAFNVFLVYPWFGVGFGGMGYYFAAAVPSFGFKLPEVISALFSGTFIPNAKNLWARLLAETGIIGTAFFVAWIYVHWKNSTELEQIRGGKHLNVMGMVGKLFIIAFIIEGFSMDTFGLPYYWLSLGLIAAAWRIARRSARQVNLDGQIQPTPNMELINSSSSEE